MPEIRVQVSDDVALLVEHLDADEIPQIVTAALRERASEELPFDVADDLLAERELADERAQRVASPFLTRAPFLTVGNGHIEPEGLRGVGLDQRRP